MSGFEGGLFQGRALTCIRGERLVFANLGFTLEAGGALVLSGANGSGKSSLLRLMAGLLAPAAGELRWDGAAVAEDPEAHRARLHYLSHLDAVKPVLSALENLTFWAMLRGASAEDAEAALERVGLGNLAAVPGRMLSAGQKRRLALARVLAAPAELWLLDEPTVGLDKDSVARLDKAIAAHRAAGGRLVVATHIALDLPGATNLALEDFTGAPELDEADVAS